MRSLMSAAGLVLATAAWGHEGEAGHTHAADRVASRVVIAVEGDVRVIECNGVPDHEPGRFPNRGNPNAIREQAYRFRMPVSPRAHERATAVGRTLFGVAVNGVVFDPGTAEWWAAGSSRPVRERSSGWNYEALGGLDLGLDGHHAHVQPTGAYHYHGLPTGLIQRLRQERGGAGMVLVGYAADGFPIYAERGHEQADDASTPLKKLRPSYQLRKGTRPGGNDGPGGRYDGTFVQDYEYVAGSGDLDECNGRVGVTSEYPGGTYYYVLTEAFPFVPRLFRGTPDASFERGGPGPEGGRPPRPASDRPPRRN